MEYKAEDPTGYFSMLGSLILHLCSCSHMPGESRTFQSRRTITFTFPRDIVRDPLLLKQETECGHSITERRTIRIRLRWENHVMTTAEVNENIRGWIGGGEVVKGIEETFCGHRRKFLHSLRDHHSAMAKADTPHEDFETIQNDRGVEAHHLLRRQKVF